MMSGKELDIGIKLERNVKKSRRRSCFCCLLYLKFFGYINGIQSTKFGLLIDTIINIHESESKGFFCFFFLKYVFCFVVVFFYQYFVHSQLHWRTGNVQQGEGHTLFPLGCRLLVENEPTHILSIRNSNILMTSFYVYTCCL